MNKVTPFLWFDNNAKEAAEYYVSVFKNSKINDENPMITSFELDGQNFIALNGGPEYKFTEAVSFFVNCENQEEVDYYWEKLSADPSSEKCGWCKDKFGLSWQIIPKQLGELMGKDKSGKVMQAMLKMKKLVVADLEKALEE